MFFTFFISNDTINSEIDMKKSLPSFILGLILSIIGAIAAYVFYAIFILIGAFTGHFYAVISLLPMVNILSFGISFVGSIICLTNRKVGGTIMIFASIISLICYAVIIISLKIYQFNVLLFAIPTLLILITGIIAIKKRSAPKLIK